MSLYQAHQKKGILLNGNENPQGPSEAWRKSLFDLLSFEDLNRYPDDPSTALIEAYAKVYGLNPKGVMAGNGSDALIQLMVTTFCRDGKPLVCLDPDFGMYHFYTAALQAKAISLSTSWAGEFDQQDFVQLAKENDAGLVLFSNPNNPTGHEVSSQDVLQMAKDLNPIVLAVDEAYMDFSNQSVLDQAQVQPNLIVTRTLSKAWGLAGIRVGFLVANPKLVEQMEQWRIVYSISRLDQLAALMTLQDESYNQPDSIKNTYIDLVQEESNRLEKELQRLGLQTGPFHANFYSLTFGSSQANAYLEELFDQHGLTVRTWKDHSRIRITFGTKEQNDQVLAVIQEAVQALKKGDIPCAK